jgi:Spy/CpxP family protein refolding chaperone
MKTTQKFAILFSILLTVVLSTFSSVEAQNGQRAEKAKARIEKLQSELNLSDAQVTSIKSILKENRSEMKEARQNKDREEMKDLAKETKEKILTVLTSEQQAKFKEMANNRKTNKKSR